MICMNSLSAIPRHHVSLSVMNGCLLEERPKCISTLRPGRQAFRAVRDQTKHAGPGGVERICCSSVCTALRKQEHRPANTVAGGYTRSEPRHSAFLRLVS